MHQRITEIVRILNESQTVVRIAELAEQFQVSQRTIRNDLNEISDLLRTNGLPKLTFQHGGQICPPEEFAKLLPAIMTGDFYLYKLSKEERIKIAAAILVSSSEFVTLNAIAERLYVSRATVINDLEEIKFFVRGGNLEVLSYPNKGLRVHGLESDKRIFLMLLLSSPSSTPEQRDIVARHISVQAGNRVIIQKIINEQEHNHQSFLTDASFGSILLYLGIMVDRNLRGEFLEPQPHAENSKYGMAQDILRYIAQYCNVTVTEDDIRFLCHLLAQARYMRQSSFEKNAIKIQLVTRQFISAISEELGINLNTDYDFFENLSNHLESVFSVAAAQYAEQDVIEEVLEDNQEVVEAVKSQLPVLKQYIEREVTEIEIAYIAVHVCAAIERKKNQEVAFHVVIACHAGLGTSQLLLEKLKQHFNFQIVDIISAHEADNITPEQADFIISTVPLQNCKLDHVIVSAQFNDKDYVRVGNKIDTLRNSRRLPSRVGEKEISAKGMIEKIRPAVYDMIPEQAPAVMKELRKIIRDYFNQSIEAEAEIFSPYLHHLLPQSNIELDVECTDWKDAVRKSAERLLERGYIEKRYIDAMISNIEENGPYIVLSKGFAMPHEGLEQGSVRVGMYLIRLKHPVPFGAEELDPVEFVCCLSAVDHKMHLKAFFNLVNMLRDESFKEMLHTCRTPEEAAAIIEKYEYSILG